MRHRPAPEDRAVAPLEVETLAVHRAAAAAAVGVVVAFVRVPVVPIRCAPAGPNTAGPCSHVTVTVDPSLRAL